MRTIGYGEDALSYWALTNQIKSVLAQLEDRSDSKDCVLFFRPSFGRSGSSPMEEESIAVDEKPRADSPQFGEFDAILGTPYAIYLIEAKWSRSSEINRGRFVLRPEQLRRHAIFRAYLSSWRESKWELWQEFSDAHSGFLEVENIRYPIAPSRSQLSRSLQTVLTTLDGFGEKVIDVLLSLRLEGAREINQVDHDQFHVVTVNVPSASGFLESS